ncbi:hypothetical protein AHAS_Ahas17G0274200 [Arachis hypogaea]
MEKHQAHRHVLVNCDAVVPFLEENTKRSLHHQTRSQAKIDSVVHAEFPHWFKHKVLMESTLQSKDLQLLACGPMIQARRFGAYNVNGYKFRTISKENEMKTQNSGVYVSSNIRSYASMRDNRVAVGGVPYYRKIWYCSNVFGLIPLPVEASNKTIWGLPALISLIQYTLAQLVYYVDGEVAKEWSVVVHVKPRDLYNMGEENEEAEVGFSPQPRLNMSAEGDIGDLLLTREENIGDLIENASENFDDVA